MRRFDLPPDGLAPLCLADYVRLATGLIMVILGGIILARGLPLGGGIRALIVGGGLMVVGLARLRAMAAYLRGRRTR